MATLPIRNKSKDNPYTLKYDEVTNNYIVEFVDNQNVFHKIIITEEVYKAFNSFELEDVSQIHKYQRHIEHSKVFENNIYSRIKEITSVDEIVEKNITYSILRKSIDSLSKTQNRRIKMYYFEDMTLQQISEKEGCSITSVKESLDAAIKKLRKIIKK